MPSTTTKHQTSKAERRLVLFRGIRTRHTRLHATVESASDSGPEVDRSLAPSPDPRPRSRQQQKRHKQRDSAASLSPPLFPLLRTASPLERQKNQKNRAHRSDSAPSTHRRTHSRQTPQEQQQGQQEDEDEDEDEERFLGWQCDICFYRGNTTLQCDECAGCTHPLCEECQVESVEDVEEGYEADDEAEGEFFEFAYEMAVRDDERWELRDAMNIGVDET